MAQRTWICDAVPSPQDYDCTVRCVVVPVQLFAVSNRAKTSKTYHKPPWRWAVFCDSYIQRLAIIVREKLCPIHRIKRSQRRLESGCGGQPSLLNDKRRKSIWFVLGERVASPQPRPRIFTCPQPRTPHVHLNIAHPPTPQAPLVSWDRGSRLTTFGFGYYPCRWVETFFFLEHGGFFFPTW